MQADYINGIFEFVGALMLCKNVQVLLKDKKVQGVHWMPTMFFTTWGMWNLFYYPSLDQWASFFGGLAIVTVNAVWLTLVLRYRNK